MRTTAFALLLVALVTGTAAAQGRRQNSQGIPPGQLPPAGMCRVWYDGVPPGRQPRATSCREAERVVARTRNARVIYGSTSNGRVFDDRRNDPDSRRPQDRNVRYGSVAFDTGYEAGLDKGREDARDRDSYDPSRHRVYRNGDQGYNDRYGSKDVYRNAYREGFRAGYDQAYRGNTNVDRRTAQVRRWPF